MAEIKIYDKIVYVPIEEIIPYENNARINNRAVDALEKIVPVAGFNVPIVITKDKVIIKGHSRYEALKKLGYDLVPCIISDDDEKDAMEERLVDNKSSELAIWDGEKLNSELRELNINLRDMNIDVPMVRTGVEEVADVTKQDMERAKSNLAQKMETTQERQQLIEVHCEACGQMFFMKPQEVQKYV